LLRDPWKGRYFIAEVDGRVVGQTMITYEWSDWRNGMFWWIQSVFVDPQHRQRGVLRALYRHIEEAARRDPTACGIRLYVEDANLRAKETYRALGMVRGGYEVYEVDFRAPAKSQA
jgi:ribosomal protein S18 acetylase RimI-like enzyme